MSLLAAAQAKGLNEVTDGMLGSALQAMQKNDVDIRLADQERMARTMSVPTNDKLVQQRLRMLGEPMRLFAEGPAERRDRIKEFAAALISSGDKQKWIRVVQAQKALKSSCGKVGSVGNDERTEDCVAPPAIKLYYSTGSPELHAKRALIANDSIQRAATRLQCARTMQERNADSHQRMSWARDLVSMACSSSEIGDQRPISSCCFTPDAKHILTSSWSGMCKLWNASSGVLLRQFKAHSERAVDIACSPHTASSSTLQFASAGVDALIHLWNFESTKPVATLRGHQDRLSRITFHHLHSLMMSTSFDHSWRLWDIETGKALLIQDGHNRSLYGLANHPDGSLVATGDVSGDIRVWDLRTGHNVLDLLGHVKQVLTLDFALDGFSLASGSGDNSIRVWDLRKRSSVCTVPGHMNMVSQLRYSRNAVRPFLVSSSYDKTCRVWSTSDYTPVKTLRGHEDKVTCVDIAPDGSSLVSCSFDRTWKSWCVDESTKSKVINTTSMIDI